MIDLSNTRCLENLIANYDDAKCPGSDCCGKKFLIRQELQEVLSQLVQQLDKKLYIKYLYKCTAFNRKISGGNDCHALGVSIDIDTIKTDIDPLILAQLAWDIGFNAVGVYGSNYRHGYKNKKGMVHIGIEPIRKYWGDWEPKTSDV